MRMRIKTSITAATMAVCLMTGSVCSFAEEVGVIDDAAFSEQETWNEEETASEDIPVNENTENTQAETIPTEQYETETVSGGQPEIGTEAADIDLVDAPIETADSVEDADISGLIEDDDIIALPEEDSLSELPIDEIETVETINETEIETDTAVELENETEEELFEADESSPLEAAAPSINATEVTLYIMTEEFEDYLTLPSGYEKTFQLAVSGYDGDVTYETSKTGHPKVSSDGLITVGTMEGDYTVIVTAGNTEFDVLVHQISYPRLVAEKTLDDWMNANLTSSMSQLEKAEAIVKYVASYKYLYGTAINYIQFAIKGGGDCKGFASTITYMCNKQGITARMEDASAIMNGEKNGHTDNMILIDGVYYCADAGIGDSNHNGEYEFYKAGEAGDGGVGLKEDPENPSIIESYNAFEENVVVPEELYDGAEKITAIGDNAFQGETTIKTITLPGTLKTIGINAFADCTSLTTITIPASVTSIGNYAFTGCSSLQSINVESGNSNYKSVDGVLMSADGAEIIAYPGGKAKGKAVTISSGVKKLGTGSLSKCQMTALTLPDTLTEIGADALSDIGPRDTSGNITRISFTIPGSVKSIKGSITADKLTVLTTDAEVENVGYVFSCNKLLVYKTSTAYTYQQKWNKKGDQYYVSMSYLTGDAGSGSGTGNTGSGTKETEHTHTWGTWKTTKAATCASEGTQTRTCTGCGRTQTQTIAKTTNHTWGSWITTKAATCAATGTQTKTCSVCGKKETQTTAKTSSHNWGSWVTTKAATCAAAGTQTRTCNVCGKSETQTVAKTSAHTWGSWRITKAATCGAAGAQTRTCAVCGQTETQTIAKTFSHSWSAWQTTKAATCTAAGVQTRTCSVCGSTETQTIAAVSHRWSSWQVTKAATCAEAGVQTRTCSVCGQTSTQAIAKSASHTGGTNTKVITAAACESDGVSGTYCNTCGALLNTTAIPAIGHKEGSWVVTRAATANQTGVTELKCAICGKTLETDMIPATGGNSSKKSTSVSKGISITLKTKSYTYNGKARKPSVTVKDASTGKKISSSYYTVKYSNNKKPGYATVTVTGKKKYAGKKATASFTILPKQVTISSAKSSAKKKLAVKWKKDSSVTGYEVQYSTSSKFTGSSTKTVTISKYKTVSKTISRLKSKKKYYVRVRAYKKTSQGNLYGKWSKTKNAKIK